MYLNLYNKSVTIATAKEILDYLWDNREILGEDLKEFYHGVYALIAAQMTTPAARRLSMEQIITHAPYKEQYNAAFGVKFRS